MRHSEVLSSSDYQHLYTLLIESLQDYAVFITDISGRIATWNVGVERVLGYTENEFVGQSVDVLFTPEDLAQDEPKLERERAAQTGQSADDRWHLRKNRKRLFVQGVMTALFDPAGGLVGFSKIMRDVTEQKLTQDKLQRSEERLRLFMDNVRGYALFQVDNAGRVSSWNPGAEHILGYSEAEILGSPLDVLFTAEDKATRFCDRDLANAVGGGRAEAETWMIRKDGSRIWARWVTEPMRDENGSVRGFAKVLQDVTARKAARETAEQLHALEKRVLEHQVTSTEEALDRTKEELRALADSLLKAQEEERRRIARELHDDLGQRLAVLEIGTQKLRNGLPHEPGEIMRELDVLTAQTAALSHSVRQIAHQLHPSILDDLGLAVALRSLVNDFEEVSSIDAHFIDRGFPRDVPGPIAASLYGIAQEALRNIVKHASGATVSVALDGDERELHLTIEDSGPGFDPAVVRGKGGLGIISMQERARAAGGSISFDSHPGSGTRVVVRVPRARAPSR